MHKTIEGEFKDLHVRIYPYETNHYAYLFSNTYDEYDEWVNDEINCGMWIVNKVGRYRDVNYLLNDMIKSKGTRTGEILYEIYCKHYPDSEQKEKVKSFWYEPLKQKQENEGE